MGMHFWDAAVGDLWDHRGLSKPVNRATSLRNFIKMLLLARGDLSHDFSQATLAALDKSSYVKTASPIVSKSAESGFFIVKRKFGV